MACAASGLVSNIGWTDYIGLGLGETLRAVGASQACSDTVVPFRIIGHSRRLEDEVRSRKVVRGSSGRGTGLSWNMRGLKALLAVAVGTYICSPSKVAGIS